VLSVQPPLFDSEPQCSRKLSKLLIERNKEKQCVQATLLDLCVVSLAFLSEFLKEYAGELGVVERDRKFQIPAFVWAFVFGLLLQ